MTPARAKASGVQLRGRHPVDRDRPRRRAQPTVHDLEQRALSGTVGPEQREHAAAGDLQVHAVQHLNAPVGRVDAVDA